GLPDEHRTDLRQVVQGVAAAEAQFEAGPVDVAVRVRQDRRGLSLVHTDRAGIDVAVDARIETGRQVDGPASGTARPLRRCRRGTEPHTRADRKRENTTAD